MRKSHSLFILLVLLTLLNPVSSQQFGFSQSSSVSSDGQSFQQGSNIQVSGPMGPIEGSSSLSATFAGPGGCKSKEECMNYCNSNPESCGAYSTKASARFEGYAYVNDVDPADMVVGKIFSKTKYKPHDFQEYCPNAEAMADAAILKLKEEGTFTTDCSDMQQEVQRCKSMAETGCDHIKSNSIKHPDGFTCSNLNKDDIYNKCLSRNQGFKSQFGTANERCEQQWTLQSAGSSQFCESANDTTSETCNKEAYMKNCLDRESKMEEQINTFAKQACLEQSDRTYEDFTRICGENEKFYNQCKENSQKMCGFIETAAQKCTSLTEADIRAKMVQQAERFCKFSSYQGNGEQGQLIAMLQQVKGDLPAEYQVMVDKKAEVVVKSEEKVESIEDKGIGYKMKWFIGAASENEKNDASEIRKASSDLRESIAALKLASEQVDNPTAKAALEEQIEKLEKKANELDALAEKKEKRANGFASFFSGA